MKLHRFRNTGVHGSATGESSGRTYSQLDHTPDIGYATPGWVFEGACADTEIDMTADAATPKQLEAQRAVCRSCPVSFQCLKELIEINPPTGGIVGVRAGLSRTDWYNYKRHGVFEVGVKFARKKKSK